MMDLHAKMDFEPSVSISNYQTSFIVFIYYAYGQSKLLYFLRQKQKPNMLSNLF